MAKMTTAALQTAMATYVDKDKQAGAWTKSTDNFVGLIDKIGKTVTIDGNYNDKLTILDGEDMLAGRTIEEYMLGLTLPTAYTDIATERAKRGVPALPSVEDVSYCLSLGREKIKTTEPFNNVERAFHSTEAAASLLTSISKRFQDSYDMVKYAEKKQLLGNMISKCITAKGNNSDVYKAITIPTDTASSEDLITAAKQAAEDASFAHEGGLGKALIGAAPELVMFVKKGVMPIVAVKALAGAFQKDELAIPAKIVVVDDFGKITGESNGKQVYAVMLDPRGVKLHVNYEAVRTDEDGEGDSVDFIRHYEHTGFISKYTFVRVFEG